MPPGWVRQSAALRAGGRDDVRHRVGESRRCHRHDTTRFMSESNGRSFVRVTAAGRRYSLQSVPAAVQPCSAYTSPARPTVNCVSPLQSNECVSVILVFHGHSASCFSRMMFGRETICSVHHKQPTGLWFLLSLRDNTACSNTNILCSH